jgi:hypothetical protein
MKDSSTSVAVTDEHGRNAIADTVRDTDQRRAIGDTDSDRADAAIWAEILHRLPLDLSLGTSELDFTVTDGIVVIEGRIDGRPARQRLHQWLGTVTGVRGLQDHAVLLDSEAELLAGENPDPVYGGLAEADARLPESSRRRGEATG